MKFQEMEVARHYAEALLSIALEQGKADDYRKELDRAAEMLTGSEELVSFWNNRRVPSREKKALIVETLEGLGVSPKMRAFVEVVWDNERLGILPVIAERFATELDVSLRRLHAAVRSARPLPDEVAEEIRSILEDKTGWSVDVDVSEDASLIGGMVLKLGNTIIDGSLSRKVRSFRETIS